MSDKQASVYKARLRWRWDLFGLVGAGMCILAPMVTSSVVNYGRSFTTLEQKFLWHMLGNVVPFGCFLALFLQMLRVRVTLAERSIMVSGLGLRRIIPIEAVKTIERSAGSDVLIISLKAERTIVLHPDGNDGGHDELATRLMSAHCAAQGAGDQGRNLTRSRQPTG